MYQHVKRPSEFGKDAVLNVFHKGIQPKWEDAAHQQGGSWTFRARKQHANIIWENLLLGFIGEQFELANEVTGILVYSTVQDFNKFQVWFRHGRSEEVKQQVRKDFLRIIDLPSETQLSFTSFHADAAPSQTIQHPSTNQSGEKKEE